MSQWKGRKENGPCVCAHAACGYNSDYMFLLFSPPANEAGETPLDIARRLKHLQCEELVSSLGLVLDYACKTYCFPRPCKSCHLCLYACAFVCVCSWTRRWQGNSTPTSTSNTNGVCSMKTWMKVMKIWMRRWDVLLFFALLQKKSQSANKTKQNKEA